MDNLGFIANLKLYEIAQKYDIPVIMDSCTLRWNAYFIQQREVGYQDWTIEQITREFANRQVMV